ncbi:hypothetical protein EYF80_034249 [Liparis tanakae]|uniref:Uncharacterized protein n=1 Tax=Liparis tanakae TaxID=230148 RepID=A0A4Z2GPL9_9TELE|nr:hypothetical protein EYF80_034249 [Liparis tanakae]
MALLDQMHGQSETAKYTKYSCGVSAPQGKDYFMMKPTHMLVLLLASLPNGAVPKKGARSLEVHAQCGKHREKREGKRE